MGGRPGCVSWAVSLCYGASLGQRGRKRTGIFGCSQRNKEIKKKSNRPATLVLSDRGAMPRWDMGVMLGAGVARGSKRQLEAVDRKRAGLLGCQAG